MKPGTVVRVKSIESVYPPLRGRVGVIDAIQIRGDASYRIALVTFIDGSSGCAIFEKDLVEVEPKGT
jgi:hypothetical protein